MDVQCKIIKEEDSPLKIKSLKEPKMEEINSEEGAPFESTKNEELKAWAMTEESPLMTQRNKVTKSEMNDSKDEEDYEPYSSSDSGDDDDDDESGDLAPEIESRNASDKKSGRKMGNAILAERIDKMLSNLCQGAPESDKVGSLCLFNCVICDRTLGSYKSYESHTYECKNHKNKKLSLTNVGKYIKKIVCHVCRICSAKIPCDNFLISRHLKSHSISINVYVKQFQLPRNQNCQEKTFSDRVIGDLCVYKCKICGDKFSKKCRINQHQKAIHGEYSVDKICLLKRVYHKCKLCSAPLKCEKCLLAAHFKTAHSMTLKEYCLKTGCATQNSDASRKNCISRQILNSLKVSQVEDDLCKFSCKDCGEIFTSLSHLLNT